jgi:AhpD family alkylhydroperoxidase
MARDEERRQRAQQGPIVGGLPEVPGIGAAMRLTPGLGTHLRGLADEVLVKDYPGATISRADRELLATAVSAANDCFFCMDSHGAFAQVLLETRGEDARLPHIDTIKLGGSEGVDPKLAALLHVARTVRRDPLQLSDADVAAALGAGATDADVQLAVLIASAFSMFNRLVDGFRTMTPQVTDVYRDERAEQIAEHGYSWQPTPSAAETR